MKKSVNKTDFKQFIGEVYRFYRFTHKGKHYELAFEPCFNGFDIALYERYGEKSYELVEKKVCLGEKGYDSDIFAIRERRPETWEHAVTVANEIIQKHFK